MKILFFGTPAYTLPYLDLLSREDEVCAVISPPDRLAGRGLNPSSPAPVKWARSRGVAILQPEKLSDPEFSDTIRELKADIGVIVAYGKLIPEAIFTVPELECINLHFSLLPRYRGASPIESALLNGDPVSGVSLQRITMELDAGDILCCQEIPLPEEYHYPELFEALHTAGGRLLLKALRSLKSGTARFSPQEHEKATQCGKIKAADRQIDWNQDARTIRNTIRAFSGLRAAFSMIQGRRHLLHRSGAVYEDLSGEPGTVLQADKHGLIIACGEGALSITEIQREDRKKMDSAAFINGTTITPGDRFKIDR